MSQHSIRFPGESGAYRTARDKLLVAEQDLLRRVWEVAALRRELPLEGALAHDYVFEEGPADLAAREPIRSVRMSALFAPGKDTLVLYSFMYGPKQRAPCPMCTSLLDSLDGAAVHARQRMNFAVVAKSPIARIRDWARRRGWGRLRLLSSAANSYNADYHAETAEGEQMPACNVFVRRPGGIRHFYNTEALYAPALDGEDSCHVDFLWPLWNLLDLTPEGRGDDFYPKLEYPS